MKLRKEVKEGSQGSKSRKEGRKEVKEGNEGMKSRKSSKEMKE